MGFGNFLNSRMATQQAQGGVPTSGFGSNMNMAMGTALGSGMQSGINGSFNNSLSSASFASRLRDRSINNNNFLSGIRPRNTTEQFPLNSTPRTGNPAMSIKDSGAPVSFSPTNVQTINGMFGSPMQNSYDRSMSPMKQDMMMNDVGANVDPITGMPIEDVMY